MHQTFQVYNFSRLSITDGDGIQDSADACIDEPGTQKWLVVRPRWWWCSWPRWRLYPSMFAPVLQGCLSTDGTVLLIKMHVLLYKRETKLTKVVHGLILMEQRFRQRWQMSTVAGTVASNGCTSFWWNWSMTMLKLSYLILQKHRSKMSLQCTAMVACYLKKSTQLLSLL
jgi:hypothetical protein